MMDDTPPHIKQMQLDIWLAKTPAERLRITLDDNDALFATWAELRKGYEKLKAAGPNDPGSLM